MWSNFPWWAIPQVLATITTNCCEGLHLENDLREAKYSFVGGGGPKCKHLCVYFYVHDSIFLHFRRLLLTWQWCAAPENFTWHGTNNIVFCWNFSQDTNISLTNISFNSLTSCQRTCKSFIGFQSCSKKMTVSAPVRFSPNPPTCVVSNNTSMDGSLLNLWVICILVF